MSIIIALVLIIGFFLLVHFSHDQGFLCSIGFHDWYGGMTGRFLYKGNTAETLPGERTMGGNQPGSVYRKERNCLNCNRSEYFNSIDDKFQLIPGKEGMIPKEDYGR